MIGFNGSTFVGYDAIGNGGTWFVPINIDRLGLTHTYAKCHEIYFVISLYLMGLVGMKFDFVHQKLDLVAIHRLDLVIEYNRIEWIEMEVVD